MFVLISLSAHMCMCERRETKLNDYKKTILKTSLWTLTIMVIACAIFVCVMIFAFPKNLGDFFYSIGSNNLASSLYYRAYEKTGNIGLCYKSLTIEISKNNKTRIIKFYEKFVNDENYDSFMSDLKKSNENLNITILEKSALLNEENYLKNRYISALIGVGETQKAYSVATTSFANYKNFTFKNQGVYALNQFIDIAGFNDFSVELGGYSSNLISAMQEYFGDIVDLFTEKKSVTSNLEKSYLISLGNRIIQVGQNINKICSNDADLIADNNAKMDSVNDVIKEIL